MRIIIRIVRMRLRLLSLGAEWQSFSCAKNYSMRGRLLLAKAGAEVLDGFHYNQTRDQERNVLVCQKKKQSNARAKMNVKANLLLLRPVNSCAKKWNIFVRANMVCVHPSRRLPLVCQRHGGLE